MNQTNIEYSDVINVCRDIFIKKTTDYGTAWRILRPSSLTDQLFIKAQRIRTIQETGQNKVGERIEDEFVAIVNYCIMALIQLKETTLKENSSGMPRRPLKGRLNEHKKSVLKCEERRKKSIGHFTFSSDRT